MARWPNIANPYKCTACAGVRDPATAFQTCVCNDCSRMRSRRYGQKNRDIIMLYKQSCGCTDCGNTDPRVLDFDHVGEKKFTIAGMAGKSLTKLFEEIAQCEVRCANCHRIKTWERRH